MEIFRDMFIVRMASWDCGKSIALFHTQQSAISYSLQFNNILPIIEAESERFMIDRYLLSIHTHKVGSANTESKSMIGFVEWKYTQIDDLNPLKREWRYELVGIKLPFSFNVIGKESQKCKTFTIDSQHLDPIPYRLIEDGVPSYKSKRFNSLHDVFLGASSIEID